MHTKNGIAGFLTALLLIMLAGQAPATAAYPDKPIHLVVPYPAGGPIDIIGRLVGQKLTERLGQAVVIDDRGGANGLIGVGYVARSAPDGYTLVMASTSTQSINPLLYKKMPYAASDFSAVSLLGTRPYILVVPPTLNATSVKALIALAKSEPGKLTYASGGGVGSGNYLAGEMFKASTGTDILHVPYKGGAEALNDVLAGRISLFFAPIVSALPQIRAGKLRALAVTGASRSSAAPDVPTMAQVGVPGFEFSIWDAILTPAKTPAPVIATLNRALTTILRLPEVQEKFASLGADAQASTPKQLEDFMIADTKKWTKVLRDAGVQPE